MGRIADIRSLIYKGANELRSNLLIASDDHALRGIFGSAGDSALGLSAVYACVTLIADSVSQVPLDLVGQKNGDRQDLNDTPDAAIFRSPTTHFGLPVFDWRRAMALSLAGWGNAYAMRIGPGEYVYLPPWTAFPEDTTQGDSLTYQVTRRDGEVATGVPASEMLHYRGPSLDGRVGLSPIQMHASTFDAARAESFYGKDFYQNGARFSGVLTHPSKLTKDKVSTVHSDFMDTYSASGDRRGTVAVLHGGLTYESVAPISPADADYINSRNFTRAEIASIFRVPGIFLNDLSKATYSNAEALSRFFVTHTLGPHFRSIESELDTKILDDTDRGYEHDADPLLQASMLDRYQAHNMAVQGGWIARNEIRKSENKARMDFETMDEPLRPLNMEPESTASVEPAPEPPAIVPDIEETEAPQGDVVRFRV